MTVASYIFVKRGQTLKTQYTDQIIYAHANNKHSAYATHIHLTKLWKRMHL